MYVSGPNSVLSTSNIRKQTLQQAPEDDEKDVVWLLSTCIHVRIQLEYSDEIQKADNPAI